MVKADKLIKDQKKRDNIKKETFNKILTKVEKKIILASAANYYFTWYTIPEFIIGLPLYSLTECKEFIIKKINKDGFTTEFFNPNILLVKWFPKD
jgi:hypothetical protein